MCFHLNQVKKGVGWLSEGKWLILCAGGVGGRESEQLRDCAYAPRWGLMTVQVVLYSPLTAKIKATDLRHGPSYLWWAIHTSWPGTRRLASKVWLQYEALTKRSNRI